jgi:hypothetical protein
MARGRAPVSNRRTARCTARCRRPSVAATLLLATVALLPACAFALAQSTRAGADRLRIIAKSEQLSLETGAVATVTGTIARPAEDTALPLVVYTGRVLLSALPRTRRCARSAPRPDPPRSTYFYVYETHFSQVLAIPDASEVAHKLRLCGYLTARRRTPFGVRTVTVARASTTVTGPVEQKSSEEPPLGVRVVASIIAWALVIVGLIKLVRWWIHDTPAARAARRAATWRRLRLRSAVPPPAVPHATTSADASDADPGYEFVQRRRGEEVAFAIQRAVGTTADVYRDRLRRILEHQDGPDWLDAFNARRRADMLARGQGLPAAYASLEPRAVLTCLAYDPAGLQLLGEDAVAGARQLCGLANAAHHLDPDKPLTDADYQRAWRLYSQITGYAPPFDTYRPQ